MLLVKKFLNTGRVFQNEVHNHQRIFSKDNIKYAIRKVEISYLCDGLKNVGKKQGIVVFRKNETDRFARDLNVYPYKIALNTIKL